MTSRHGVAVSTCLLAVLFLGIGAAAANPTYDAGFARLLERAQTSSGKTAASLAPVTPASAKRVGEVRVHVQTDRDPSVLEALGIAVGTRVLDEDGTWHLTARLPLERLTELLSTPGVQRLEASRQTRPHLDQSLADVGGPGVQGPQGAPPAYEGLSGRGVVVGIIDTGIDLDHEDFLDSSGNPRIAWLWDQTDDAASPGGPSGFSYGTEWSPIRLGEARQIDERGHGSHVAGIAVGSGRATDHGQLPYRFVGVAPEATIVAVKTDFSTTGVLDAVDYVFRKAVAMGLPAVVNLSLGSQSGPHDGTGSFARGVDALVGPGRIVVASAGNEGGAAIHAEVDAAGVDNRFTVRVSDYLPQGQLQNDAVLISAQAPGSADVQVRVVTPGGTSIGPVSVGTVTSNPTPDGTVMVDNGSGGIGPNGHREIEIQLFDGLGSGDPAVGVWTFEFTAAGGASSAEVDAWIYLDTLGGTGAASVDIGLDLGEVVASPAVADEVIAVASYVTRTAWQGLDGGSYSYPSEVVKGRLSLFSSFGPRRDGVVKPDLAAPGQGIFSTLSSDVSRTAALDAWIEPDERHQLSQGTSQAAPHVAGAVALLLQRYPTMAPLQARSILTGSAREDEQTSNVPNAAWGHGKLDLPAAVSLAEQLSVAVASFTATPTEDGVDVRWFVEAPGPATGLRLERQIADEPFELLGTFPAVEGESSLLDRGELDEDRRYRLWATVDEELDVWLGEILVQALIPAPLDIVLRHNSPNPFNPRTTIPYFLPAEGQAELAVFDLRGRRLRTLVRGFRSAGEHQAEFDGLDNLGLPLPSGIYVVRLAAAGQQRGRLITLTK